MTPSRHSPISENPAKNAPKMPSWTSMPGTNQVYLLPPSWEITGSRRGPKSSR
jgi:hypothetical protein